jgi:hypothetical protein
MSTEVFGIPSQRFTVFRAKDGAVSWSGNYQGMQVVAASPIDDARCVILLDGAASKVKVFEYLLCVERSGKVVWKAGLPDQPDVFVKFEMAADGLRAWTWSAWMLRLDLSTGRTVDRQFLK